MTSSVDQASFAEMVSRMSGLLDEWRSVLRRVLTQELTGPGPVALTEVDHGGKALLVSNGSATASIALQLPAGGDTGVLFLIDQAGAAPARFVAPAGKTIHHRLGHNGTAGQWASVSARRLPSGDWLLSGDTAVVG